MENKEKEKREKKKATPDRPSHFGCIKAATVGRKLVKPDKTQQWNRRSGSVTAAQTHNLLSVYKVAWCESNYNQFVVILFSCDECVNLGGLDNKGRERSASAPRSIRVRRLAGATAELPALRTVTALKLQLSFTLSPRFHTYLPSPFPLVLPTSLSDALFLILSLSPSLSDGSITGAMLRELLQPSLSGCVSSNVRVEPCNLLTMQEKGKREEGGRG